MLTIDLESYIYNLWWRQYLANTTAIPRNNHTSAFDPLQASCY